MPRTTAHIPKGTHMLPRAKYNTVGFHFPPAGQIREWRVYEPWSGVGMGEARDSVLYVVKGPRNGYVR